MVHLLKNLIGKQIENCKGLGQDKVTFLVLRHSTNEFDDIRKAIMNYERKSKNYYLREKESWFFTTRSLTKEFYVFVENEIWPLLTVLHHGYRIKEKKEITAQIAHQMIETGLTNKVVADSRDYNRKEIRKRIPIWDAITKNKLCIVCKGSQFAGKVTLYGATSRLLKLREIWKLRLLEDLDLKRNTEEIKPTSHALVVLTTGKTDFFTGQTLPEEQQKKPTSIRKFIEFTCERDKNDISKPNQQAVENGLSYFRAIEDKLNSINKENLSHSWRAYTISEEGNKIAFQPNVCLRQIHSGRLFRAARLYSWGALSGQGMTQEQRETIEIDSERAAEIDSHCHAIRLAYHLSGIDERGDIYWPEKVFKVYYNFENVSDKAKKIVRDFVKIATNIALNTNSQKSALQAIAKSLRDNENYKFLNDLIFNIEEKSLSDILKRIVKAHPVNVADKFFTEVGLELMRTDGAIMLQTLKELVIENQIPALAIHDALVVRKSDVVLAEEIYSKVYSELTSFKPVFKRKY
jgi:hypothetical protein